MKSIKRRPFAAWAISWSILTAPFIAAQSSSAQSTDYALAFDGTSQSVDVPTLDIPAGAFTLEAWVYVNQDNGQFRDIFSFGGQAPLLGLTPDGHVDVYQVIRDPGDPLPVRVWTHVAYSWDGVQNILYLNGVEVFRNTTVHRASGNGLTIGADLNFAEYWPGLIDDARVWSVARSAQEIQANMRLQLTGSESGLAANWPFNEGSGNTAMDISGNGHTGMLVNNPVWSEAASTSQATLAQATLPNLKLSSSGEVYTMLAQPDGKIIIGGAFFLVNNVPRKNLARLNPNGSLDETWNPPSPNYQVVDMELHGTDLYIAGEFTSVGGIQREKVAKLTTLGSGALDPDWDPESRNNTPPARYTIAIHESSLYIGGSYGIIGGQTRSGLARLNLTDGAADPSWNPAPDGLVESIISNGNDLFIGGSFTQISGQFRQGVAKFDAAGAIDMNWDPGIQTGGVSALAIEGADLFLGGSFADIGGLAGVNNLAKVNAAGTGEAATPAWTPNPNNKVTTLAVRNGDVYLAGYFTSVASQPRQQIAKVSAAGSGELASNWRPSPAFATQFKPTFGTFNRSAIRTLLATDSAVFVGGNFQSIDMEVSLGVARLGRVTGTREAGFPASVQFPGKVYAIARQTDGRLILGGEFLYAGGQPRQNIVRVHRDGTLDTTWAPDIGDTVTSLALDDGNLFVGGFFTNVGGFQRNYLAKIATQGSDAVDPDWNGGSNTHTPFDGALALEIHGPNLFVGGSFTSLGGANRNNLAKLNASGSGQADPNWNPSPNSEVGALAIHGDDLIVGGRFSSLGGVSRLAKVSTQGAGAVDTDWTPSPAGFVDGRHSRVSSLLVDEADLYVGGVFTSIGGQARQCLAKLSVMNGSADPVWDPIPPDTANFCNIRALSLFDTQLYIGGDFFYLGSHAPYFRGIARVSKTGAGAVDLDWIAAASLTYSWTYTFLIDGDNVYMGGTIFTAAGTDHNSFILQSEADAPVFIQDSQTDLFIRRNIQDGSEVTHFRILSVTGASLFKNDGVTRVNVGDYITVSEGAAGLKFAVGGTLTVASALNATPAGEGSTSAHYTMLAVPPPVFTFGAPAYSVREGQGNVVVTVQKIGEGAATVDFSTADLSSTGGLDYESRTETLSFTSTDRLRNVIITIADDLEVEGDEQFQATLTNPETGASVAGIPSAVVTLMDNDGGGVSDSLTSTVLPGASGPADGVVTVSLAPAGANGQWRLAGQLNWRDSGAMISGLVTGNYSIEFRPANGYYPPSASPVTVPIQAGMVNNFSYSYAATSQPDTGTLSVRIEPADIANAQDANLRGQWRRQGTAQWMNSGELAPNLAAGSYAVEFKPLPGLATPLPQLVQVGGSSAIYSGVGTYFFASGTSAARPEVTPFAQATGDAPYLFNGQLQSSVGFGSGFVVKRRVVLTAAHVLFDDVHLTYSVDTRWFFQRYRDEHEPMPQTPRGWYSFDGYAAQRELDNSPGISTPASQNLDVAALYFLEDAGRGGYGGYLSSDADNNEYLLNANNKFLVGYPLDGVQLEDQGKLFATPPANLTFTRLYTGIFATPDIQGFPGNSGGPLYVQSGANSYLPAALILGGSGQTLVRVINGEVVDLINRAEISSNGGGNISGGGVSILGSSLAAPMFGTGQLTVNLSSGGAAGVAPGWRIKGTADPAFILDQQTTLPLVGGGEYPLEFKVIPGFLTPGDRIVQIAVGQQVAVSGIYVPIIPTLSLTPGAELSFTGGNGASYIVEYTTRLLNENTVWIPYSTQTLSSGSITLPNPGLGADNARYYRVRLAP
jgi:hypothetical protein